MIFVWDLGFRVQGLGLRVCKARGSVSTRTTAVLREGPKKAIGDVGLYVSI